jgi:hypothetical protein
MKELLSQLLEKSKLTLNISEVILTNHLNEDETINYKEVLLTLKRLFR